MNGGLGREKEQALAKRIARKDLRAAQELAEGNVAWADALADRYMQSFPRFADDIMQAARLGLVNAARHYHPHRARFTTYSRYWIELSIHKYLCEAVHFIHVPQTLRRRAVEAGRNGDASRDPIGQCTPETWDAVCRMVSNKPASLDVLEDVSIALPFYDGESVLIEHLEAGERTRAVGALLAQLKPRQRKVLIYRFGLDGAAPRTLSEVGKALGVSREWVRQIQDTALASFKTGDTVGHKVRVPRVR